MHKEHERFADSLLAGDATGAWEQIARCHDAGVNALFIYQELITRAMHWIGDLWEQGLITVADEHLATSICDVVLTRYDLSLAPQPMAAAPQPKALFFCLEQEQHYMGLKIVASLFAQHGWEVRFLGPDLPLEYALTHTSKWKPDVVGLSFAMSHHIPSLHTYLDALTKLRHRPQLLVGGRLVNASALHDTPLDNVLLFDNLQHVHAWLSEEGNVTRWTGQRGQQKHA